jgi:hypothetical protein
MKDRAALTASTVVLAGALIASGVLLFRAWRNVSGPPPAERARALNVSMDEAQAELAANESLLRVRGLAARWPDAAGLEDALSQAARSMRRAVSRDDADLVRVQLAAVAFHASEAGEIWVASPLGDEDVDWLRRTLEKQIDRPDGSAYVFEDTRSRGIAFATFGVAGETRRGGMYWMLALRSAKR